MRALCACGGSLVAAGGNDGMVRLWDAATGQAITTIAVTISISTTMVVFPRWGTPI